MQQTGSVRIVQDDGGQPMPAPPSDQGRGSRGARSSETGERRLRLERLPPGIRALRELWQGHRPRAVIVAVAGKPVNLDLGGAPVGRDHRHRGHSDHRHPLDEAVLHQEAIEDLPIARK